MAFSIAVWIACCLEALVSVLVGAELFVFFGGVTVVLVLLGMFVIATVFTFDVAVFTFDA
jgi:hypothetical protein